MTPLETADPGTPLGQAIAWSYAAFVLAATIYAVGSALLRLFSKPGAWK
ncbi:MAG TPA: hypothetical protein VL358_04795 [Caulobacteraceae bacterium]|nr:hypothetical protein [Caulobacteraceae bacterium]